MPLIPDINANKMVKVDVHDRFPERPRITVTFDSGTVVTAGAEMWFSIARMAEEALTDWSKKAKVPWWQ